MIYIYRGTLIIPIWQLHVYTVQKTVRQRFQTQFLFGGIVIVWYGHNLWGFLSTWFDPELFPLNANVHIFSAFTKNVVNWDKNTALFETKEGVIEGREEEERERGEWNRNKKNMLPSKHCAAHPPYTHDILRHNDQLTSRSHCEGTDASHIPTEYKMFKFFLWKTRHSTESTLAKHRNIATFH